SGNIERPVDRPKQQSYTVVTGAYIVAADRYGGQRTAGLVHGDTQITSIDLVAGDGDLSHVRRINLDEIRPVVRFIHQIVIETCIAEGEHCVAGVRPSERVR